MSKRLKYVGFGMVASVMMGVGATSATADSVPYPGPIITEGGVFDSLVETSITDTPPLYGAPTVGPGNMLTFDTTDNYVASVTGEGSDITSGALEFTFQSDPNKHITSLSLEETGAWEIVNYGGVSAGGTLTVRYLDELSQQLVTLADPILTVVTAEGLPDGGFPFIGYGIGTWRGTAMIDFAAMDIQTDFVIVALDNTLIAQSCECGSATISKDQMKVTVMTETVDIPEPASLALMAAGLAMFARRRG